MGIYMIGYVYLGKETGIPANLNDFDSSTLDSSIVCPRRLNLNLRSKTIKSGCARHEINASDYKRIIFQTKTSEERTNLK